MAGREEMSGLVKRGIGIAVGAVFIYAGVVKALDPAQFAADIGNYRLLPIPAGAALALYLPWLEVVCGGALVFKQMYRGALIVLAALCVVFMGALLSAKARGLDIACGCFGNGHPHPPGVSLLLDAILLAVLIFLLI